MKVRGEEMKVQRKLQGKTLRQVEAATGLSNASISRWESGKVVPSIDACITLADYYGVSLDELVGRDFPVTSFEKEVTKKTLSSTK